MKHSHSFLTYYIKSRARTQVACVFVNASKHTCLNIRNQSAKDGSCYTKFATTAEGPKMSQAKELVEAKFSVRECFTSRL